MTGCGLLALKISLHNSSLCLLSLLVKAGTSVRSYCWSLLDNLLLSM